MIMKDIKNHPCFNPKVKGTHGRVHLPVAPSCNISCNYCNRKYDCVNESRPGVTSSVLKPMQAITYLENLLDKMPGISVIGIAGPGDPFANPAETLETLSLINDRFPDKIFCLSSNGLNIYPYIDNLKNLGVSHVTITLNGLEVDILEKIYRWVRHEKKVYQGKDAAALLLEKQLLSIKMLKEAGITVKINTLILPGINTWHIPVIAKEMASMEVDVMNCMPVYPVRGSVFEKITAPSKEMVKEIRSSIAGFITPMSHCARCRADAAGLLGQDNIETVKLLQEIANRPLLVNENRPFTAVASYEGMLVNQHLGEAKEFFLFEETSNGYKFIEHRKAPGPGGGDSRWVSLSKILHDCRAVMVGSAGQKPTKILESRGIKVIQMTGLIDEGLNHVYKGKELKTMKKQDSFSCGQGCNGNAQGCA